MNKRARLTRRILREHRRGMDYHMTRNGDFLPFFESWLMWSCTHCSCIGEVDFDRNTEVPYAYR